MIKPDFFLVCGYNFFDGNPNKHKNANYTNCLVLYILIKSKMLFYFICYDTWPYQ